MLDEYVFGTVGRISPEPPCRWSPSRGRRRFRRRGERRVQPAAGWGRGSRWPAGRHDAGRFVVRMLKGETDRNPPRCRGPGASHHRQDPGDRPQPAGRSRGPASRTPRRPGRRPTRCCEGAGRLAGSTASSSPITGRGVDRRAGPEVTARRTGKGIFVAVDPKRPISPSTGAARSSPRTREAQAALGVGTRDRPRRLGGRKELLRPASKAVLITRGERG